MTTGVRTVRGGGQRVQPRTIKLNERKNSKRQADAGAVSERERKKRNFQITIFHEVPTRPTLEQFTAN